MTLRPLSKYVLLEILAEKKHSSIEVVESKKETECSGVVMGMGENVDVPVNKGQKVLYKQLLGTEVSEDGKKLIIVEDKDILAVYE